MVNGRTAILGLTAWCIAGIGAATSPLTVHEWGTFTSFQDADGATIAGINVDDEPVPWFVHRLGSVPATGPGNLPARWSQGAPSCHPEVTMRLETPVLYFYPPSGWPAAAFDVQATFAGGWLTEYFPAATADRGDFPKTLDSQARGSLLWRQVRLDPDAKSFASRYDLPGLAGAAQGQCDRSLEPRDQGSREISVLSRRGTPGRAADVQGAERRDRHRAARRRAAADDAAARVAGRGAARWPCALPGAAGRRSVRSAPRRLRRPPPE